MQYYMESIYKRSRRIRKNQWIEANGVKPIFPSNIFGSTMVINFTPLMSFK